MRAAGLKAIDTVVESTAVLIKSKHISNQKLVDLITARIMGVIGTFPLNLFACFALIIFQPLRDTSFVNTILHGPDWPMVRALRPEDERQPSLPSRKLIG